MARRSACGSRDTNHGLYPSSTASQRNEIMAVLSHVFPVRRREMQVRPRRREGASFSQIRCRNGRSVRRGCERDAQPKTAARSLLPCSRLRGIARYCAAKKYCPGASVRAPSAVLGGPHDERRSPQLRSPSGLLPLRRTPKEPMLRKGNVLDCVDSQQGALQTPYRSG